ncbi:MAG: hypothetical protein VX438_03470 [Planctomycetota bacterium]|nr:hypothetical protein [Planctomycetota bacterium]
MIHSSCFTPCLKRQSSACLSLLVGLFLVHGADISINWASDNFPNVQTLNIRRVFYNGEHNAFTDLVKFGENYYLTFRSCPDGHMVHPTASVIILQSANLKDWKQVFQFSVKHRDTRDPHFLIFNNRLFVYTGTWYSGDKTLPPSDYDLNQHLGYAVWSKDGVHWSHPQMMEGTFGHYIWRAASFGGKAYLCGRRKIEFDIKPRGEPTNVESLMLESDDGLIWKKKATFQEIEGDETAFLFNKDASIIAIGRRGGNKAQLLSSKPPYSNWQRLELSQYIGGPNIQRWGDRIVVGGRQTTPNGPRTSMYWLDGSRLVRFAVLPSGGDNSYPGFLPLSKRNAVVSWYSSHEQLNGKTVTAIYMADLVTDESPD